jgi:manganese/iron transport system permease protein/iron/zinc/copper transport system permease protein
VVGAVQVVGVVLVVGLLVTPAATAYLLSDRLTRMLPLAALFGVSSVVAGLYVSLKLDVASGSAIVIMSTLQFMLVLACAPRYGMIAGWWRRKTMVPQQLLEDVLGCFRKELDQPRQMSQVMGEVDRPPEQVQRAVRNLGRRDWMEVDGQILRLTEQGRREAKRILRAHRLWETYLQHVGMPVETLHDQAHRLEHVHDEQTVDYLDDKLGHPLTDPHGAEIPEDFEHLVPGEEVKVSLMREGHAGVVTSLEKDAIGTRLSVGERVVAGRREGDGRVWILHLPDGSRLELDHELADSITVRFDKEV